MKFRKHIQIAQWAILLIVGCWLSATVGCGSASNEPLAMVTGKVTKDGQPLIGANIMFIPETAQGAPSGGQTDASGEFQLKYTNGEPGAIIGKHRVVISMPTAEAPAPMGGETKPVKQTASPEYFEEAEISEGDNNLVFEVQD